MDGKEVNREQIEALWKRAHSSGMSRRHFLFLMTSAGAAAVLAACAPKGGSTPTATAPPTTAPSSVPGTTSPKPTAAAEKPKAGGVINVVSPNLGTGGEVFQSIGPGLVWGEGFVLEQLLGADYARSMAGTGEYDLGYSVTAASSIPSFEFVQGSLAESFQMKANGDWVFNIRQGVRYALDPNSAASKLVNGREMTADDVVHTMELMRDNPKSRQNASKPFLMKAMTVKKTGPWQVTISTPEDTASAFNALMGGGGGAYIQPAEWQDKYGQSSKDWRDQVGTGPYTISNFVSGSQLTLKKNPTYWRKNPVGPGKGDPLPYPDGINIIIVPDTSRRLAAIRTGQADIIEDVRWEDAQAMLKERPNLKSHVNLSRVYIICMRLDKKDLPFKDVRVRQALMMAIDHESIKKNLYGGQAELRALPVDSSVANIYVPDDQLPASVRKLYKYDPEGAKQLLAAAGYSKGFKTKIIVQALAEFQDLMAIIKDMWAKVGVEVEIQPKEGGAYNSLRDGRAYEELYLYTQPSMALLASRYNAGLYARGNLNNLSWVNENPGDNPPIEKMFDAISANVMANPKAADQAIKEATSYILEQCFYITPPTPFVYRLWQPWIKNYYGEGGLVQAKPWAPYPWVDQALKEQMGAGK